MQGRTGKNFSWRRFFKGAGLILAALFILLSAAPYFITVERPAADRRALTYDNSEFAAVKDVEIHFRLFEPLGAGEDNVLLVHGFGASTFSWRHTAPALQDEGMRVLAVDLPGFGLSERKQGLDHSPGGRAEYMWLLLDDLYPGESWHLVGHSMGGAAVTAMALQEPDRVESITLAAGALIGSGRFGPPWLYSYPPLKRWVKVLSTRLLLNQDTIEDMLASAYGRAPAPEEVEGYYLPVTVEGSEVVLADLLGSRFLLPREKLVELDLPVLCLWGEYDEWVPLERGKELAELLPGAELVVIPEEGHCPMETAPHRFNPELLRFLQSQD